MEGMKAARRLRAGNTLAVAVMRQPIVLPRD